MIFALIFPLVPLMISDMTEINTLTFQGDTTTFVGLLGLVATFGILVWIYRSYWISPYRK
jgi:hypothetical protein